MSMYGGVFLNLLNSSSTSIAFCQITYLLSVNIIVCLLITEAIFRLAQCSPQ